MNALRQLILTLPNDIVLALNAYFEARGEWRTHGDISLVAVMAVVMNRAAHPKPGLFRAEEGTVQSVVAAPRQFSWTNWDDHIKDPQYPKALEIAQNPGGNWGETWEQARKLANRVLAKEIANPVANATFYYNPHVCNPSWAEDFEEIRTIGNHRFMTDPANDPEVLWEAPRENA